MRRSPWLLLLWLAAAVGAGVLYYGWQVHADLIGIVERRTHVISAEESGKLSALLVEVGRRVSKGDSVALLDSSALQAERKQLESELEALEQVMEADRRRFALEHDVLSLSITERRADKVTRDARLRAGRAEAAALDKEIARLKRAEKAGLGHPEQLGELVVRRRALGELNESLARGLGSLPDAEAAVEGMRSQAESVVLSKGGDRLERVMEVRDRLVAVTEREKRTVVTAPADGYITEILTRPGDAVQAFAPILTLAETATAHVDVYISESKDLPVAEGATVEVVSRRPEGGQARATVTFVDPGYQPLPPRLAFGRQEAWSRRLRLALEPGHGLQPGEFVRVRMQRRSKLFSFPWAPVSQAASGADTSPAPPPPAPRSSTVGGLAPITVSDALRARTRFEPSGVIWLEDLERFLIVSDDTGLKSKGSGMPWLFLMDAAGRVEDSPVTIEGLTTVSDLEAVTASDDGHLYLVASSSVSKRGKRPKKRQLLMKVRRDGRRLVLTARVPLLDRLEASLGKAELRGLGLEREAGDGRPLLNIEAMVWHEGGLLLGLKEPVSPAGAILWRLERPDAFLESERLKPGQLTLFARVDLGSHHGRASGFSDLEVDARGALLALSTIPGAPDAEQVGKLVRLQTQAGGPFEVEVLRRYLGLKPEGLARAPGGRLLLVFDAGAQTPQHSYLEVSR